MSYRTTNELDHFDFRESYIAEMQQLRGYFTATLDSVTIQPENSKNRDIRPMRTNNLTLTIPEGQIISFIEEGYQVLDPNGNLSRQVEDRVVTEDAYPETLKELSDCQIYSIEKKEDSYVFSIDTEDHTYLLTVKGETDTEEWDLFMNL